ncbi:MAG: hypothetical protein QXV52_07190 [Nitrososphaeria archaeon]
MSGIKVYVSEKVEERFRQLAMMIYGYGRGSLSKAAEDAFMKWITQHEISLKKVSIPEDPINAIRGMLSNVKKSGVELQHEARRIRATKAKT